MGLTSKSNKQGIGACTGVRECCPLLGVVPLVNNVWGTGEIGENWSTGVSSAVLLKGDFNEGFNVGMSIVNCWSTLGLPLGGYCTQYFGCLICSNVQQMQFPQVIHLGNKLCEHLYVVTVSFVTVGDKGTVGDLRSTVGDLLVDRSGLDSTVGDQSSGREAKSGVGGLWAWAGLAGVNASTPGV